MAVSVTTRIDPSCWSLELLQVLDWKLYQELCAALLQQLGYDSPVLVRSLDGCIDVVMQSPGGGWHDTAVQCRRWRGLVGLSDVGEFYGAALRRGFQRAFLLTTSRFTRSVREEFGRDERLFLIDGEQFLETVADLGRHVSEALLAFAVRGEDFHVPTCPQCGIKMWLRLPPSRQNVEAHWACRNYVVKNCSERLVFDHRLMAAQA